MEIDTLKNEAEELFRSDKFFRSEAVFFVIEEEAKYHE